MDKSSPPPAKHAFTLIELLVVIAILGVLVAISADKITKPVTFIVFSPAQDAGNTVKFNSNAIATAAAPGVTENAGTSSPGGAASGGISNSRTKITALCADWHVETMAWSGT